MSARYLKIEAKELRHGGFIASVEDFTVSDGAAVDADIILRNRDTSLYCFDDDAKEAIFVELSPDTNLAQAPFVYTTQFEMAQCLIAVPYEEFRQLAKTLPPVEHLIMMYISGRSGSTLLSHVFNELDNVLSLSEPDVITQFVHLREADPSREAALRELADCTVRMLFKPNNYKNAGIYALKFRVETLRAMDLFQATFPHARNLYSYRDVTGFVTSFYRMMQVFEVPEYRPIDEWFDEFRRFSGFDLRTKMQYLEADIEELSAIQFLTLWWMVGVEWYLEQVTDIDVLPVRYRELKKSPAKVVEAIFAHCGLPVAEAPNVLRPFEDDSQAGTILARENPDEGNQLQLSEKQKQDMARMLARHPIIQTKDYEVPNTLQV